MEILKNKWLWIAIAVVVLVIVINKNKGSLSSLFGTSSNYEGDKPKLSKKHKVNTDDEESDDKQKNESNKSK